MCARGVGLDGYVEQLRETFRLLDTVWSKCAKSRRGGKRAKFQSPADPYYPPMYARVVVT
jgi:hypothetical protein